MTEKKPIRTIVDKEGGKVVGYACANCQSFYSTFVSEETARQEAERCCNPTPLCCVCSKAPSAPWRRQCKECEQASLVEWRDRQQKQEQELSRFEAAKKIPYAEYTGEFLYFPDTGVGNEGYLPTDEIDDEDWFRENGRPEYAWACEPVFLSLRAGDIVEHALSEHHEDAGADIGPEDYEELQKLLDAWCEKQNVVSYHATNVAVLLPPMAEEEEG